MEIDIGKSKNIRAALQSPVKPSVVHRDSLRASEENPSLKVDPYSEKLTAFHSPEQDQFRWSRVLRSPSQLRLHPTLVRLKLIDAAIELNHAVGLQGGSVPEPILIIGITEEEALVRLTCYLKSFIAAILFSLRGDQVLGNGSYDCSDWFYQDGAIGEQGFWDHIEAACSNLWLHEVDFRSSQHLPDLLTRGNCSE